MFYVWTGMVAFYFLSRRQALAQTALVALAYGLLLVVQDAPNGSERWLITTGTVLVTGLLVGLMKARVERLLGDLRAAVREMARVARTDPLTGLLNRRGFSEMIERELERTRRTGQPFSLLLCDLDHFKRINDNFGHAAGDDALVRAAETICDAIRGIDAAARTGGEEFAVVLPDTEPDAAYLIAERLRTEVQDRFARQGLALTISTGIASAPAAGADTDSLLKAADAAMYKAKGLGRNRSVIHRAAAGSPPVADAAPSETGSARG
jgi:diguanylate cyclase (GGDEF)-like protein